MRSSLPKVLHPAQGKPMLGWVLDAARGAGVTMNVVVVGFGADRVVSAVEAPDVRFATQTERLGTGHAVMQAAPLLDGALGCVLLLAGDTPLLRSETLAALVETHRARGAAATVLSARLPDPHGYGRIVRSPGGGVLRIVEEIEAGPEERIIDEINTGAYCFEIEDLKNALGEIRNDNAKGEYYLTDTIAILLENGRGVEAVVARDYRETLGVNTPDALATADTLLAERRTGSAERPS